MTKLCTTLTVVEREIEISDIEIIPNPCYTYDEITIHVTCNNLKCPEPASTVLKVTRNNTEITSTTIEFEYDDPETKTFEIPVPYEEATGEVTYCVED